MYSGIFVAYGEQRLARRRKELEDEKKSRKACLLVASPEEIAALKATLKELEDEPAYKRQGLELDQIDHSSSESNSRVVLDVNDEDVEIKNNNSFLHDNVD